ncbi:leucyl aminopeptidase [Candidatus Blochmannia ocreatus (nom. nud.)]|uniref:Probable cytosol aminopeptidase n=1 Tax=Candidatus Blochmannia ocreatus (nom. nud.) TaxID=251538 RepID=A0ABY4SWF7_9ENTR|nr:leucyl aminopeptidase [Candidatus Blochmannia ocreatus]URJ25126.1 leucyl aminopeptidase [Candidatus Blochmannia ocreatus]
MIKFNITDDYIDSFSDSCVVTGVFEKSYLFPSTKKIDNISNGYISSLLYREALQGKITQTLFLYDVPNLYNKQILLIGCGEKNSFDQNQYKKVIHAAVTACKNIPIVKILLLLSEFNLPGCDNYWKIRQTIEIVNEELYVFNKFKNKKNQSKSILNEITLYIPNINELKYCQQAIKDAIVIARGVNIAKDLGNLPPNFCTPNYIAEQTQELSKYNNISIDIIDFSEMKKLGMNAYLAVNQGSNYPPIMPIIKYQGHKNESDIISDPIILIGKGLTFDSGGISIKDAHKMDEMKYDMCGAAAVYAVMYIAAELQLPLNIIGILAVGENMISSNSFRPGDILTTLSGKTIEILNTDAEGRLILCDTLTYAKRYKPSIVIDIATLTGACVVALGNHFSGLMCNEEKLSKDLIFASQQTKDYIWRLPLHEEFQNQLKSTCADMTNVGGRSAGAITAGCFLQKFVKYPWAHLDIAGTAWISHDLNKSSTGRPVTLLSQFLLNKLK